MHQNEYPVQDDEYNYYEESPPKIVIREESTTRNIEDPKNAFFYVLLSVAYACLSYLMPLTLCLYIKSLPCPAGHQLCEESSYCVRDPLTPNKTRCVSHKGFRETADGTCIGKLPYWDDTQQSFVRKIRKSSWKVSLLRNSYEGSILGLGSSL